MRQQTLPRVVWVDKPKELHVVNVQFRREYICIIAAVFVQLKETVYILNVVVYVGAVSRNAVSLYLC